MESLVGQSVSLMGGGECLVRALLVGAEGVGRDYDFSKAFGSLDHIFPLLPQANGLFTYYHGGY